MIIAGAEMGVGAKLRALAPHHQRDLGVGLVLDEAIDDLHARALKVPRPAQIGLFIKARLQFHQRRDVLACFRRLDQGRDDGRVLRGPVQRLLDGDDVRVPRRLTQEFHHHVKALIGMVNDQVLGAHRRKDIAPMILDPLWKARLIGIELQLGPLIGDHLSQLRHAQQPVHQLHVLFLRMQLLGDKAAQLFGHARLDLQAHQHPAAALLEQRLELAHQILGLFLDLDIAVANDPEGALADEIEAGEQRIHEQDQDRLERDEAFDGPALLIHPLCRDLDEALHPCRHGQKRVHDAPIALALELEHQGEAQIGNERERVRRIDRQRRDHRQGVREKVIAQPFAFLGGQRVLIDQLHPFSGQQVLQLAPGLLLGVHQVGGGGVDLVELLAGRAAIHAGPVHAVAHLGAQAGHADHVELVQIARRDRQEAQALQHRMARIPRLLDDPPVELQPGQLAIDEPVRRRHQSLHISRGSGG